MTGWIESKDGLERASFRCRSHAWLQGIWGSHYYLLVKRSASLNWEPQTSPKAGHFQWCTLENCTKRWPITVLWTKDHGCTTVTSMGRSETDFTWLAGELDFLCLFALYPCFNGSYCSRINFIFIYFFHLDVCVCMVTNSNIFSQTKNIQTKVKHSWTILEGHHVLKDFYVILMTNAFYMVNWNKKYLNNYVWATKCLAEQQKSFFFWVHTQHRDDKAMVGK